MLWRISDGSTNYNLTPGEGTGDFVNVALEAWQGQADEPADSSSNNAPVDGTEDETVTALGVTTTADVDLLIVAWLGDDQAVAGVPAGAVSLDTDIDGTTALNHEGRTWGLWSGVLGAAGATGDYVTSTDVPDAWVTILATFKAGPAPAPSTAMVFA
jgi:hypothetical protein